MAKRSSNSTAAKLRHKSQPKLTIHALGLPVAATGAPYYARAGGPESKLNTWGDGLGILRTIVNLYRAEHSPVAVGLVLDTVTRGRRETKLLAYVAHRVPGEERRA